MSIRIDPTDPWSQLPERHLPGWLSRHCLRCHAVLADVLADWRRANAEYADAMPADRLVEYMELLGISDVEELRRRVADGSLLTPPVVTVRYGCVDAPTACDEVYHLCGACWNQLFTLAAGDPEPEESTSIGAN